MEGVDLATQSSLLAFDDVSLENRYQTYRLKASGSSDKSVFILHCVLYLVFIGVVAAREQAGTKWHWTVYCYSGALLLHGGSIYLICPERFQCRTFLTVCARLIACACAAYGTIPYWDPDSAINTMTTFWWKLLYDTASIPQFWFALTLPLSFRLNIFLHSIAQLANILMLRPAFCQRVLRSHLAGPQLAACNEQALQTLRSIMTGDAHPSCPCRVDASPLWPLLGRLATVVLSSSYFIQGLGRYTQLSREYEQRLKGSCDGLCLSTTMFVQLVMGWLLPSAMVYLMERKSRHFFLLHVERHQGYVHYVRVETEYRRLVPLWQRALEATVSHMWLSFIVLLVLIVWEGLLWLL